MPNACEACCANFELAARMDTSGRQLLWDLGAND